MDAKNELLDRLSALWAGDSPPTDIIQGLQSILQDYSITKESDSRRSNLEKRVKYFLGAKRIDGYRLKHLTITASPLVFLSYR